MIQKLVNIGVITVTSLIAILLSLIVLGISVPPLIWLLSFIDTAPEQNDCAIGSVDRQQFERLLREAKRHDWTVWPGLSNGILEPSDRGIKQPWPHLRRRQGEKLLDQIKELVPDGSGDAQLAATHAVMRSIGAEYGRAWTSREVRAKITFEYYLPQARFAPWCMLCLLWPTTSVQIVFRRDAVSGVPLLDRVDVQHSNLKDGVERMRNVADSCPEFLSVSSDH